VEKGGKRTWCKHQKKKDHDHIISQNNRACGRLFVKKQVTRSNSESKSSQGDKNEALIRRSLSLTASLSLVIAGGSCKIAPGILAETRRRGTTKEVEKFREADIVIETGTLARGSIVPSRAVTEGKGGKKTRVLGTLSRRA